MPEQSRHSRSGVRKKEDAPSPPRGRPETKIAELGLGSEFIRGVLSTVETEIKFAGYLAQQERQVQHLRDAERRSIPSEFLRQYAPAKPGSFKRVNFEKRRVAARPLNLLGSFTYCLLNFAASIGTFGLTSVSWNESLPSSHENVYLKGNLIPPTSR